MTLYNEIEPYAAKWIGNLVDAGHVAPGVVDTRSIAQLTSETVRDHAQVHFFAGVGVWSHALRSAGWPDTRSVWSGSCPCQPFSSAGRSRGFGDERHLWPEWFRLIRECRPPIILGEQVASPDGLRWLDLVSSDLEGAGYAFGAADLCAAGVGAPHIRQRLYFVAVADRQRREGLGVQLRERGPRQAVLEARGGGKVGALANGASDGWREGRADGRRGEERARPMCGNARDRSSVDSEPRDQADIGGPARRKQLERAGADGRMGDAMPAGLQERPRAAIGRGAVWDEGQAATETGTSGFWSPAEWLPCQDGRLRPVEPGTFPLAHGVANRVGKLRAYGNALCAPLATRFVEAVMQVATS